MATQDNDAERLVIQAIATRHPGLNANQCEILAQALIREIAAKVGSGSTLAILELLPDGSIELNRMVVDRIDRTVGEGS